MTVCIAAICKGFPPHEQLSMVVGATDRMLTGGGQIEFEPKIANKIVQFSTAIFGMFAGDFALQSEILEKIIPAVKGRIAAEPKNWWAVQEVAELYAAQYKQCHLKRSENAILAPLGLDIKSFIARQKEMDSDLVKQLASKLIQFESPAVEAIFCGLDLLGPHIFVVDNSANAVCHDVVGFASIGVGGWHANSHFMFANHTWLNSFPQTLLLTYSAKKRAEVAPGVGGDTDMFVLGPGLGSCVPAIGPHVIKKLQGAYDRANNKKRQIDEQAQNEIAKFHRKLVQKATKPKDQQGPTSFPVTTQPPPPSEQSSPSAEKKEPPP